MRQLLATILALVITSSAYAQKPVAGGDRVALDRPVSNYENYQKSDAKAYLTDRARYLADQRLMRLESNRWYGYSPNRPNVTGASFYGQSYTRQWSVWNNTSKTILIFSNDYQR